MTTIKLAYDKEKKEWRIIKKDSPLSEQEEYGGYKIVSINKKLWEKVKRMIEIKKNGWDSVILIDGKRRSGKSTLAQIIAYILDPDLSMSNFVKGLNDSIESIDNAKDGSVLIFDEGSLIASSKDGMAKKNKQLLKVIDVVGQKRLSLIFCMPSFFRISREIAVEHSLFLIHVYTDAKLHRGSFAYYSTNKKKILYELGKKNFGSYLRPTSSFTGKFNDFKLPFNDEYLKLKRASLREALNPDGEIKDKPLTEYDYSVKFITNMRNNNPKVSRNELAKGLGVNVRTIDRYISVGKKLTSDTPRPISLLLHAQSKSSNDKGEDKQ